MGKKQHTPVQIIFQLHEAEIALGRGQKDQEVCRILACRTSLQRQHPGDIFRGSISRLRFLLSTLHSYLTIRRAMTRGQLMNINGSRKYLTIPLLRRQHVSHQNTV
jgi:hypothetical protein